VARRCAASWRTEYPASAEIVEDGYAVRIILPIVPPSLNELKKRYGRQLAAAIRKQVKQWLFEVLLEALRGKRGLITPEAKRRVTYTMYRSRLLDQENVGAGTKPVTDELVAVGLLKDDSPAWCEIVWHQVVERDKGKHRTEIMIEEIE